MDLVRRGRRRGAKRLRQSQVSRWGIIVAKQHRSLADLLDGSDPRSLAACLLNLQRLPESDGITQGETAYCDDVAASDEGRRAAVAPFHDMLALLAQYLALQTRRVRRAGSLMGATLAIDQAQLAAGSR